MFLPKIEQGIAIVVAGNFFMTTITAIFSCSSFLNYNRHIFQDRVFSFLSFFLFPGVAAIVLLILMVDDTRFFLPPIISFNLCLLVAFVLFRKGKI
jgi:hypothetical protein